MTRKKDLKRRVRERQARTGESYTAALAHVRKKPVENEALPDATEEAKAAGLHCSAVVSPKLRALGDLRPFFARLRELLEALESDACGPLLRGEPGPRVIPTLRDSLEARRFLAQVQAGTRGLSRDGRMFALAWNGHVVVGAIWLLRKPLLMIGLLDDAEKSWPDSLLLAGLGR